MDDDDAVNRVYETIIEDVIRDVEVEFENEGVDPELVEELRALWQEKLAMARAAMAPVASGEGALPPASTAAYDDAYGTKLDLESLGMAGHGSSVAISAAALASLAAAPITGARGPAHGRPSATVPPPVRRNERDRPPQLDGPGDSDNDINSDLDEDEGDEDEDDQVGNKILCVYEKVQRHRNRWRMSLRDGIVEVEDRDHLFHRATVDLDFN